MDRQIVHISEADLARDVLAILQRVKTGAEIIIERDAEPIAILRAVRPARRTISSASH